MRTCGRIPDRALWAFRRDGRGGPRGDLPAFDEIAGQDAEFFSEGLGEVAQIGKSDLAARLLDTTLPVHQQLSGTL